MALFCAPVAAHGFSHVDQHRTGGEPALTSGLIRALRQDVPMRDVVFSDDVTAYRIAAYAPVYVNAAPPAHVADTKDNLPYQRRRDANLFVRRGPQRGDLAIPRGYHAQWIVIDKARFQVQLKLPRTYEDGRYVLYRLRAT
jgi:hypothetical protein